MENLPITQNDFDDPRIRDTDLANALGYSQPLNIRSKIAQHYQELLSHGEVLTETVKTSQHGGRPSSAYLLNESQALVLCALSRTKKARDIRSMLIEAFKAFRDGKTVHVREHYRRPPQKPIFLPESQFRIMMDSDGLYTRIEAYVPADLGISIAEFYFTNS